MRLPVSVRMRRDARLQLFLLLFAAAQCTSTSPPGKPVLLGCRSPEKETFTCWWEPGVSGGLPTTHRLYYERERLEGTHECPDYRSAGDNSCFFDKTHTSIWVDYYLRVVASNALGNTTSDVIKMDVMEIVKPNAPSNVTLLVVDREESPSLHMSWEPPHDTDTRSGWVTLHYQLRVQEKDTNKWKEYKSGTQTQFTLYSVNPGAVYRVQVRCKLDHGSWSEWSNTTDVKIPANLQKEKPLSILVFSLSVIPLLAATCVIVMKRKSVQLCLLPPVPGPKIKGVDIQHLKRGRSEDVVNALIISQHFPPMMSCKDLMEDYLLVSDDDAQRNSICPAGLHVDLGTQRKNSPPHEHMLAKVPEAEDEMQREHGVSLLKPPQQTTEVTMKAISSYVDIQIGPDSLQVLNPDSAPLDKERGSRHMEDYFAEDYSKVKEMNGDNMVFLETQSVSLPDTSCGDDRYTNCTKQKPRNPALEGGVCTQLVDRGYVATISVPPII